MWFDESMTGTLGGILGCVFGGLGALLGTLGGTLAPKGKAKTLVLGLTLACLALGAAALAASAVAGASGQPAYVWRLFLVLGASVFPASLYAFVVLRKTYARAERKKMELEDI